MARLWCALTALLAAAALAAPAARANSSQESIFQDDAVLLDGNPAPSLDMVKGLGANTIHTLAFWNKIAPNPKSSHRPSGDLSDPASYKDSAWAPYDALVREANARGLSVLLSPTGFTPRWAECPGRNCRPNAKLYGQFVAALGRRYSGTFQDSSGNVLPRVKRWSLWNEPDQVGWINPQSQAAPLYRNLVYAGLAALKKTGHGHDQVLLGETAPVGRGHSTDPTTFLLNLFCIDAHGHRLRGRAARQQGCTRGFKRFSGITGFAHHPYNVGATGPALRAPHGKGDITLATLSRLTRVLRLGAHAHVIRTGLPVYFTEYGIQTRPPNRKYGVPVSRQAMWLNEADWLAYKNRSVRSVAQYELFDGANTGVFTTGLLFHSAQPKPSFDAYRLPVWVTRQGSGSSLWLWVRPAAGTPQQVEIQHDTGGGFQTAGTKTTNSHGFAVMSEPGRSGRWRIAWTDPAGVQHFSRAASVTDH